MGKEGEMNFQILGPLEVVLRGRPLELTAAKQKALLANLLLHPNEVVSSDRLIDELWGSEPPGSAANALQVYVSQLRGLLEPHREKGKPSVVLPALAGGYLLRVEPLALDAYRFEQGLSQGIAARIAGNPAGGAEQLRRALALWGGAALADFTYEPFAQSEIVRLEELRVVALEERIEADLALGGHAALVSELEGLVREHPLRERLRGELMLALYRCGRQVEALELYQESYRILNDELGILPGPELRELEQAILRQDPDLAAPKPSPRSRQHVGAPEETAPPASLTRRPVTVVMIGRAPRDEPDPETRLESARQHLESHTALIERHGGILGGTLGDRLMGLFGVPRTHEDDALRAGRAALALRTSFPEIRIGIATGLVVSGEAITATSPLIGPPVTRANELENLAAPGEIRIATETRELLGASAEAETEDARSGWRLDSLAERPPPLSASPASGLVGRERELAQLQQALDGVAANRTTHLFTLIGTPGIGKTRLAEEFAARVATDTVVLAGRCIPYGEGITFWPLREMVAQLTGDRPLREVVASEEKPELLAERIEEAIVTGEPTSGRDEIFFSFRRLLWAVAQEHALVLVFEDIHWAEPTLLDLVEYLAERESGAPILLLCLARPELHEERPGWGGGKPNSSSLRLERLSQEESEELVDALAGGLSDSTRTQVLEVAEGNPLFLGQILAMLKESGPFDGDVPIPATIQALLSARLDRLGPGQRTIIDRAAVIGKYFWAGAVIDLLPEAARSFASRHLDALVRKDLLSPARSLLPGEQAVRFRHVLIQQAAYRAVPKQLRAVFHEGFADWLESVVGTTEHAEIAGYHLEQAHRCRFELGHRGKAESELAGRAANRLALAGRRAFDRGDMPASAGLLRRASLLLPADDPDRVELLPDLGYSLFEIGELDRAEAVLLEAEERARALRDQRTQWRAAVKRQNIRIYAEPAAVDLDALDRTAQRAIEALEELGDDPGLARAWILRSEVLECQGNADQGGVAAERASVYAKRAGSRREEAWALGQYGWCMFEGSTSVGEAIRLLERILTSTEGETVLDANMSAFLAMQEAMAGRFDEARGRVARSRELTSDLGLRWQAGVHAVVSAYIELFAADPAAAERDLGFARQVFAGIHDNWFQTIVEVDLLRPMYEQGRYDEAVALIGDLRERTASFPEFRIKLSGIQALLLARTGGSERAEVLAREAVALATECESLLWQAQALLDLAVVLKAVGQSAQALLRASEAIELCERKGSIASVAAARDLTSRLEGSGRAFVG
jgi:DNA-binding SARP family transcriptional activator